MYVSETYLTSDFEDPGVHLKRMLKDTLITISAYYDNGQDPDYYEMLDTYKIIFDFCDMHNISTNKLSISVSSSNGVYIVLKEFYTDYIMNTSNIHESIFTKKLYTFTDHEHETIQTKINNLREKILQCTEIDEEHKQRVLKKLEDMQATLHKKMSTLDGILGAMLSIAHTLGKSAEEAKPFTNDFKEIMEIALRTKSRGENLPENEQINSVELLQIAE